MDPIAAVLVGLLAIVGLFGFIFLSALWGAFVFTKLWIWFVVPLFGLPVLTLAQAYGLMLIVNFLKPLPKTDKSATKEEKIANAATILLSPLVILGIGYFVKSFFL